MKPKSLLQELPDDLRGALPDTNAVRQRSGPHPCCHEATTLRLACSSDYCDDILALDRREREITKEAISPMAAVSG